jgi:hypothetical protein
MTLRSEAIRAAAEAMEAVDAKDVSYSPHERRARYAAAAFNAILGRIKEPSEAMKQSALASRVPFAIFDLNGMQIGEIPVFRDECSAYQAMLSALSSEGEG